MKRKWIPPFLMLFTGAISAIIMYSLHYPTKKMLVILLAVLIVFYIIGSLFQWMLNLFDRQNEEQQAVGEPEISEENETADEQDGQAAKENK